jgi:hypothetical protein
MLKLIKFSTLLILALLITQAYSTKSAYADNIQKPIEDLHENNPKVISPFDFNADEESRSAIPGIFTDITKGDDDNSEEIKPEGHRGFTYGFHRTLQSLTDIGNGEKYNNQLQETMKSQQVVAFITAAQTQPAAAAGLHYGAVNAQLTLINQQLSHQSFFEQMKQLPDSAQLLQSMYTGCIYPLMKVGNSFAKAQTDCIGDKGTGTQGLEGQIATARDITDHKQALTTPEIQDEDEDKITCTDLIFKQQEDALPANFIEDFIKWFGDEETIIMKTTEDSAAAEIGRKRKQPEEPLTKRYEDLVRLRFADFGELMRELCEEEHGSGGSASGTMQNLKETTTDNVWTNGTLDEYVGLLSIEGYDFNTMVADALLKTFYKISSKNGETQVNCRLWNDCHQQVYTFQGTGSGNATYNPQGAAASPIAKLCKNMHDYSEGVALGYMVEILARMKRIILDFTSGYENSDARACGMRILHDQIKTNNLEEVQYQAIQQLVQVGQTIYNDKAKIQNMFGTTQNNDTISE